MPNYRYLAKESSGRSVTGVSECADEKQLVDMLRKQGLIIISINLERKKESAQFASKLGRKIKLSELVIFSRQLATIIDSGISLVQGLDVLTEQAENPHFKAILATTQKDVSSGMSFHEALSKHPGAFSNLFVNMVKAGESSGTLDDILDRLAGYIEKTDSLTRKVRSALIYPSVVSVMAVIITLVLMIKVVPVFKSMFDSFGGTLPVPTQILIGISNFLIHYFFVWTGAVAVFIFLLVRFLKTDKGTMLFDRFKLDMPVFGVIFRKVAVSKFARTLSTLTKSGVPILQSLEIVGKTSGNRIIEGAVDKVRASIREGESISAPLMKSKVFPPMVTRMVAVGEQTGNLEKMLTKIADFYDDQVDAAVSGITSLIEPLVIAFLGIIIGSIVICMFLPIFKLASVVSS